MHLLRLRLECKPRELNATPLLIKSYNKKFDMYYKKTMKTDIALNAESN